MQSRAWSTITRYDSLFVNAPRRWRSETKTIHHATPSRKAGNNLGRETKETTMNEETKTPILVVVETENDADNVAIVPDRDQPMRIQTTDNEVDVVVEWKPWHGRAPVFVVPRARSPRRLVCARV